MTKNPGWLRVLQLMEMQTSPITFERLRRIHTIDGCPVNAVWLSKALWAFVTEICTPGVNAVKTIWAGNEEYNGFELWRRMYLTNEGGAEQVQITGYRNLLNFEKCTRHDQVILNLGLWNELRANYGQGIPDAMLKTMFESIMPDSIATEILNRRDTIKTLQQAIDYVIASNDRYTDARVAQAHTHHLKTPSSSNVKSYIAAVSHGQDPSMPQAAPPAAPPSSPGGEPPDHQSLAQELIAAFQRRPGKRTTPTTPSKLPKTDPEFKGCWHCGKVVALVEHVRSPGRT